jgi:transposase-like protein
MSKRKRRHFSPEDKIKILRLHLLEGRPISELCEEHGIHPTLFYQWQKTFFENGASAFESKRRTPSADQALIARLQGKLRWPFLEDLAQGQRLRVAAGAARSLARGFFLPEHRRHLLLPVQRARWDSRYIVAWDVRTSMQEADAEIVLQRGREAWPGVRPRIISDRGSQFAARDFKEFIRLWQTSHVLTSPHYPQSNGKLERFHRTLKQAAIRPKTPLCLEDARRVVGQFIEHYNSMRLHSAIGYVTPRDRLEGRADAILRARDEKLEQARALRARKRQEVAAR